MTLDDLEIQKAGFYVVLVRYAAICCTASLASLSSVVRTPVCNEFIPANK